MGKDLATLGHGPSPPIPLYSICSEPANSADFLAHPSHHIPMCRICYTEARDVTKSIFFETINPRKRKISNSIVRSDPSKSQRSNDTATKQQNTPASAPAYPEPDELLNQLRKERLAESLPQRCHQCARPSAACVKQPGQDKCDQCASGELRCTPTAEEDIRALFAPCNVCLHDSAMCDGDRSCGRCRENKKEIPCVDVKKSK